MEWREEGGVLYAKGYCVFQKHGKWRWCFGDNDLGECHSPDEAKAAAEHDSENEDREYERDYEMQFTVRNSFTQWKASSPTEALVGRFRDLVDDVGDSGIEGLGEVVDARIWDSISQTWIVADKETLQAINGIRQGTQAAVGEALKNLTEKMQQERKGTSDKGVADTNG